MREAFLLHMYAAMRRKIPLTFAASPATSGGKGNDVWKSGTPLVDTYQLDPVEGVFESGRLTVTHRPENSREERACITGLRCSLKKNAKTDFVGEKTGLQITPATVCRHNGFFRRPTCQSAVIGSLSIECSDDDTPVSLTMSTAAGETDVFQFRTITIPTFVIESSAGGGHRKKTNRPAAPLWTSTGRTIRLPGGAVRTLYASPSRPGEKRIRCMKPSAAGGKRVAAYMAPPAGSVVVYARRR